jgi:hypothetical protein
MAKAKKVVVRFENEGSPDEVCGFFNDLLVEQKFGSVGVPTVEASSSGEIVGVIYDPDFETITLVAAGDESLFDEDDEGEPEE